MAPLAKLAVIFEMEGEPSLMKNCCHSLSSLHSNGKTVISHVY